MRSALGRLVRIHLPPSPSNLLTSLVTPSLFPLGSSSVAIISIVVNIKSATHGALHAPVAIGNVHRRRGVGAYAKAETRKTSEAPTLPVPMAVRSNAAGVVDVLAKAETKTASGTPTTPGRVGHWRTAAVVCKVGVGAEVEKRAKSTTPTLLPPARAPGEAVDAAAKFGRRRVPAAPTVSPSTCILLDAVSPHPSHAPRVLVEILLLVPPPPPILPTS